MVYITHVGNLRMGNNEENVGWTRSLFIDKICNISKQKTVLKPVEK